MTLTKVWGIDCVVGTRPNFVKIAPVLRALRKQGNCAVRLVHTGQHYDEAMNGVFFDELDIPDPDVCLDVGPGTQVTQTARIMLGLEAHFEQARPDAVVVVGDVTSTLAAAIVAAKMDLPLVHIEAGLRSMDRSMPEEINRVLTDQLADLLLTTERAAAENLLREGVSATKIRFVGNVMIDSLYACLARAPRARSIMVEHGATGAFLGAISNGYAVVTLHRPSNVDDPITLKGLAQALRLCANDVPLVFAMHPRTRAALEAHGLAAILEGPRILITPPLGYLSAIGLLSQATLVITDSGGIQEETTALGVPCLTVRENTERPITILEGTNTLVGSAPDALRRHVREVLRSGGKRGRIPELWDGKAAERAAAHIVQYLKARASPSEHDRALLS